ncbi:helix-turn-helix domain-containing protein [Pseudomonas sp. R5(2019)]|uniref:helix-turn-helix domain-containing protein n=1 Tax=Pseudomonas sp. R5(2019) TaxID=2697566 RepID=UPI00141239A1|nr:helix-turn-helix transcriptional regulator [Pseudomonas sp. R5(2019)]NBA97954.1 helix-turn-helix domain-containing protein [Pseudomonas sp. R5(2019)]
MKKLSSSEFSELSAGECLREERTRLGLKQEEMAQIGGITRNTQGSYERDERRPDTGYLKALHAVGLDVLYVVTGVRTPAEVGELSEDEEVMVRRYRSLPPDDKKSMRRFLQAIADDVAKSSN